MSAQTAVQTRIAEEMASFQRTMEELRLLNRISKDLRSYKKLMQVKEFD